MRTKRATFLAAAWGAVAACALMGCSSSENGAADVGDGGTPDATVELPPTFSDEEWAILRELAPETLPPPPPDASNAWADDAEAAAFGALLFVDARFSGALLDADNDGGPNALGTKGETGKVACEGCHMARSDFSDTRSTFQEISLGTGWTLRRTPSLLDVGQAKMVLWGGRQSTLYAQVFGPLENPLEMNSSRLFVAQQIAALYAEEYEAIFGTGALEPLSDVARFPRLSPETTGCQLTEDIARPRALPPDPIYECHGMPGDQAEYDSMTESDQDLVTRIVVNAGKAIGAFERTLICGPGRFDSFVLGDATALTPAEQRGLKLFIGRAGCVGCHSGPYLSDQRFHNVGVAEGPTREGILNAGDRGAAADLALAILDPLSIAGPYSDGDDGRLPEGPVPEDEGAFRTPTLRCVADRPSYMHSGLVTTLDQVISLKSRGGDAPGSYPGVGVLEPLDLTREEQRDLLSFLSSLDGLDGL